MLHSLTSCVEVAEPGYFSKHQESIISNVIIWWRVWPEKTSGFLLCKKLSISAHGKYHLWGIWFVVAMAFKSCLIVIVFTITLSLCCFVNTHSDKLIKTNKKILSMGKKQTNEVCCLLLARKGGISKGNCIQFCATRRVVINW